MINITVDDSFLILGAIVKQALRDVHNGSPGQKEDAQSFLDTVAPSWSSWPAIHQQRGAIVSAARLAAAHRRPKKA